MKQKINWWVILAIIVIGAAVGFVGTGYVKQHLLNNDDAEVSPDTASSTVTDNHTDKVVTVRTDTITEKKDSTPVEVNTTEDTRISVPDTKNEEKTGKTDAHDNKKDEKSRETGSQDVNKEKPKNEKQEATATIKRNEDEGQTGSETIKVTQAKATPAAPKPITKAEAQAIVTAGNANEKVPDNCRVEVNGTSTTYGAFRGKVKNGDYTDVKVTSIATDQDGKASTLKLTAKEVVKPTPITKEEVQSAIGKEHSKIPRNCKVIVNNNSSMEYWNFCRGMKLNAYSNVKVKEVTTDASGKATVIKVTATVSEE